MFFTLNLELCIKKLSDDCSVFAFSHTFTHIHTQFTFILGIHIHTRSMSFRFKNVFLKAFFRAQRAALMFVVPEEEKRIKYFSLHVLLHYL